MPTDTTSAWKGPTVARCSTTASTIGRSCGGPVEKYSSSDIPGAQSCDCPERPNRRPQFGHVQPVIVVSDRVVVQVAREQVVDPLPVAFGRLLDVQRPPLAKREAVLGAGVGLDAVRSNLNSTSPPRTRRPSPAGHVRRSLPHRCTPRRRHCRAGGGRIVPVGDELHPVERRSAARTRSGIRPARYTANGPLMQYPTTPTADASAASSWSAWAISARPSPTASSFERWLINSRIRSRSPLSNRLNSVTSR